MTIMNPLAVAHRALLVLALLMLTGGLMLAQAQKASAEDYKADSPDAAVKLMEKALKAADKELFLECLPKTQREGVMGLFECVDTLKPLSDAMEAKFGKPFPNLDQLDFKKRMKATQSLTLLEKQVDAETAKLKVKKVFLGAKDGLKRTRELDYQAIVEDGHWRLIPPEYNEEGLKRMANIELLRQVAESMTADINENKFDGFPEAVFEFGERLSGKPPRTDADDRKAEEDKAKSEKPTKKK